MDMRWFLFRDGENCERACTPRTASASRLATLKPGLHANKPLSRSRSVVYDNVGSRDVKKAFFMKWVRVFCFKTVFSLYCNQVHWTTGYFYVFSTFHDF